MTCFFVIFLIYTWGFTTFIIHSLHCIVLSRGARRKNYQTSCFTSAFRSYFPTFSPMLLLLVKNGNSVLFGFILSSEQFEVNIKLTHQILLIEFCWPRKAIRRQLRKHTKNYREQASPIGPSFQLNSLNNFSANRSVVFKSLYVIVLRLGKTFEDHVFQSNQLSSRVHI